MKVQDKAIVVTGRRAAKFISNRCNRFCQTEQRKNS